MRPFARFTLATAVLAVLAFLPAVSAEGDYQSASLGPGESYSFTFENAGSSYYHCHPHPQMEARITIEPSDGAEPQTHVVKIFESGKTQSTWGFDPAQLTIKAGDTVEWINEGKTDHLVMGWLSEDPDAASQDGHDHDHVHDTHATESPVGLMLPLLVGLVAVAMLRRR